MKVSSWYTAPCQRNCAATERLFPLQLHNFQSHISLYSQKYSKPAVYRERGTVLVTCVIIQKIIHEKRKFGTHMKYFSCLSAQSSENM